MPKISLCTILFLLLLSLLLSPPLKASWQTYETQHFLIHFPEELRSLIPQVAYLAEDVHRDLIDYYNYEKRSKTHLIIKDETDFSGGYADPHLLDQIVIHVSPPLFREFGTRHESWLRLVLAHEYGHILHLNLREGALESLRNTFGKVPGVTTPNQFLPWWMLEGYAIMAETQLTGGGRGEDSLYDMYMRTAFLEDQLYDLHQIHGPYPLDQWPTGGLSIYLYGASLFQYLSREYGMERLVEVSRIFSTRPTGGLNGAFFQVYGKSAQELFLGWKKAMEKEYRRVKDSIEEEGITPIERLTHHGYRTYSPLLLPSQEEVIYYHSGYHFPGLRSLDLTTKEDTPFLSGNFAPTGLNLSWDREGILYARADYQDKRDLYLDLYYYHLPTEEERRLTYGERARDGVLTPSGDLIYVVVEAGESRVILREDEERRELLSGIEGYQYSQIALSPYGDELALIIWRPGGYQDLYLYSLTDEELLPITSNQITIEGPSWSHDGEYILFSADKGGIYNLYAYHVEKERFYQITNLLTGAFDPLLHPKTREILFVGYSKDGFDLYKMPYQPHDWKRVSFPVEDGPEILPQVREDIDSTTYNPLPYLTPRYLIPNLYLSTQGSHLSFITGGKDPLDTIHYNLSFEYEGDGSFFYSLGIDGATDLLNVHHSSSRERGVGAESYYDIHSLQLTYPLTRSLFHLTRLGGGVRYRRFHNPTGEDREDYRAHLFLNRGSVSGRDTLLRNQDLLLQANIDSIDRDLYFSGIMDVRERFSLSNERTLSLRGAIGIGERRDTFALGGLYGYFPIRGTDSFELGDSLGYFFGEYREVIHSFKQGQGLHPIFYDHLSGALFLEGGLIRQDQEEIFLMGYGGELSVRLEFFYGLMPLSLNLGVARTTHGDGSTIYFSFQYPY